MLRRRDILLAGAAMLAAPAALRASYASDDVSLLPSARRLQAAPYVPPTGSLAPPFADLNYNAYRGIRPINGRAAMLPHGDRFAVDLLPPGLYFPDPVRIDRVTDDGVQEIAFRPDLFSFDPRYFGDVPAESPGAGFTGLRLRYPLNAADRKDEVLVVQGASYFRAIGQAMVYGLSARAVALGTGGSGPEEFPRFTHLRLHPSEGGTVRIEGVIDSPSLAGHLEMVLAPGLDTHMDIAATILPRRRIDDIGIAPLTSMYLKGPMRGSVSDDFRPRVHDSDVLFIANGAGEKLWRPIVNPARIETSAFADTAPAAYGLFQTPRDYAAFDDTEARYHDRPSAIVTPTGDWGRGAVTLVEIPTDTEFMDNIVAFWRPDAPLEAGSEHRFAYHLAWTRRPPPLGELAEILQSRSGREHDRPGYRRYVIDIASEAANPQPVIEASGGATVTGASAFALPQLHGAPAGTRVTFLMSPGASDAVELRLSLRAQDGTPLSPVWLHRWTPSRDGGI
jgi:glucans biosynthesis protein